MLVRFPSVGAFLCFLSSMAPSLLSVQCETSKRKLYYNDHMLVLVCVHVSQKIAEVLEVPKLFREVAQVGSEPIGCYRY